MCVPTMNKFPLSLSLRLYFKNQHSPEISSHDIVSVHPSVNCLDLTSGLAKVTDLKRVSLIKDLPCPSPHAQSSHPNSWFMLKNHYKQEEMCQYGDSTQTQPSRTEPSGKRAN